MGEIGIEGGVIITVDGVSGRYWLNERSGVQAIFGFTSFEDTTGVVFSGRYLHGLIVKPFSMLYAFGGLDLDLLSTDDNDENWFGLGAGCGVEFCIPQLEELAFYGEIGLQYQDATGGSAFGTSGEAAGSFGFHYYL